MGFIPKNCENHEITSILNSMNHLQDDEIIELQKNGEGYIPVTRNKYGVMESIWNFFYGIFGKPHCRRMADISQFMIAFIDKNQQEIVKNINNLHTLDLIQNRYSNEKSAVKREFATALDKKIQDIKKARFSELENSYSKKQIEKDYLVQQVKDLPERIHSNKYEIENLHSQIKLMTQEQLETEKKIPQLTKSIECFTVFSEAPESHLNDFVENLGANGQENEGVKIKDKIVVRRDIYRLELSKQLDYNVLLKAQLVEGQQRLIDLQKTLELNESEFKKAKSEKNKADMELLYLEAQLVDHQESPSALTQIRCKDNSILNIHSEILEEHVAKEYIPDILALLEQQPSAQVKLFIDRLYGKSQTDSIEELFNLFILLDFLNGSEKMVDSLLDKVKMKLVNMRIDHAKEIEAIVKNHFETISQFQVLDEFILFSLLTYDFFTKLSHFSSVGIKIRRLANALHKQKDPRGNLLLGMLNKDLEQLQKAADGGLARVQNYIGYLYYHGSNSNFSVSKNQVKGMEYYALAADQNLPLAVHNLGNCYKEKGEHEMAKEFYTKAAKLGHQYSIKILKECYNIDFEDDS